jgi:hypothetical protein
LTPCHATISEFSLPAGNSGSASAMSTNCIG